MLEHKKDHYPLHGSWHSVVKGMRKAADQIDTIIIDGHNIFVYIRHDDDKMWCQHFTIDDELRTNIDAGRVGIGEEIQMRLERRWPI